MPEQSVTKTVDASDVGQQWKYLLDQVSRNEARLIVEENGTPVAAIVSLEDLQCLQALEEARRREIAALQATRDAFKDVPDEELEAEVAKAVVEARAEIRVEKALQRQRVP